MAVAVVAMAVLVVVLWRVLLLAALVSPKRVMVRAAAELVDWLFVSALSRPPSEAEHQVLVEIAGTGDQTAVADLLWSVFMLPEFQIIR